jgi:hypothetical protein
MTNTARAAGRLVGVLLLAQVACGMVINLLLLPPVIAAPGFLANAASHSTQVGLAASAGLVGGALWIAVAASAFPVFRVHSRALAVALVAVSAAGLATAAAEQVGLMSMLSLSESYAKAAPADAGAFSALRGVVAAARNWAHYVGLIVSGATFLLFFGILFRFALVPRSLAAFGVLGSALQMVAVAMPLFGHEVVFPMLAPLGLAVLAHAGWLIRRGLRDAGGGANADSSA